MALRSRPRNTRLLVVTLVCVSLLTITLDYKEGDSGPLAGLGRTALSIVAPLQEGVTRITRPIGDFVSAVTQLPSLRGENEQFQDQIQALKNQQTLTSIQIRELDRLETMFHLSESLKPPSTGALVIASGVGNSEWTVEINK